MNRFFEALRKRESRFPGLLIFTGLVVTFVRHVLDPHRVPWDFVQFLSEWFVHTVGLIVLSAFAYMAIFSSHKFFLGEDIKESETQRVLFYIVMTVLVASVCILLVAGYVPADED